MSALATELRHKKKAINKLFLFLSLSPITMVLADCVFTWKSIMHPQGHKYMLPATVHAQSVCSCASLSICTGLCVQEYDCSGHVGAQNVL